MNFANVANNDRMKFDRVNAIIAALVFGISFVIFYLTKAPTFSFWDCGEFVACSYILGIPHPPGSPLYILIGRIFTVLPIAADIAVRTNLVSVFTSSFTATFAYLVLVRLIRYWYGNSHDFYNRVIIYIGGFTGALFAGFSSTNWGNSVEAEVYAPTMAIMLIIYWLTLKFFDEKGKLSGSRAMLLALYLGVLGVGIHLTIFSTVPVIGLYFILKKEASDSHWLLVSLFFLLEMYFLFRLSSRPGEIPIYLPILITFIFYLFHVLHIGKMSRAALVSLVLYVVSLYPFYFVILDNLSSRFGGQGLSVSVKSLGELPIEWIGLVGLLVWGAFSLVKRFSSKTEDGLKSERLIVGAYSLAPVLLIGLGEFFSIFDAFDAFKIVTMLLLILLGTILWKHINLPMLVAVGAISMVILGFWQFVIGLAVGAGVIIILAFVWKDKSWRTALAVIVLAVVGYSVHGFIPIRSAHNPSIDENNPSESLTAMVGYLERKQYGSETMTERMFKRRAEWKNQFGDYRRMGFWGFFKEQYGFDNRKFFIAFILGLFGLWEVIRRKPKVGLPFFVVVVLCTIGIVLYMNFADGTRQNPVTGQDYIEVRNRDYFFTAGFVFFGMAIGLGIAALMSLIRDTFRDSAPVVRKSVFGLSSLLVLLPLFPLGTNYFINDRSRNYMPYDYANNLLMPCKENAIFITNGDNDTFPVWCIQEVYGVRKDVQTVNLSLANAPWYIKQLRKYHNVPIGWSDAAVDRLRPFRTKDGTMYRLQDQVVDEIITRNKNERPIYVSVTTPAENRRFEGKTLDSNLILEGMVYQYTTKKDFNQIDYEKTRRMFENDYNFRGVADSTVFKDEATQRLVNNYAQGILWMADTLRKAGDYNGALERIRRGLQNLPESFDLYGYGTQLLADLGRADTLETFIDNARTDRKEDLYLQWGYTARALGRTDEATHVFELVHEKYPDSEDGFRSLAASYYKEQKISRLKQLLRTWLSRHPNDSEVRQALNEVERYELSPDTSGGR